jgi:hypothetical protein
MVKGKNPIAVAGGRSRARKLTPAERKASARKAAHARWKTKEKTRHDP